MKPTPLKSVKTFTLLLFLLITIPALSQGKKIRKAIDELKSQYTLQNDKVVVENTVSFNNLNSQQIYDRTLGYFSENKETTAIAYLDKDQKIVRGYIKFLNIHEAVGLNATAYHASCKISFNIKGNNLTVRILSMDYIIEGTEGGILASLGEVAGEIAGNTQLASDLKLNYNDINTLVEINQEAAKQEKERLGVIGDFKITSVYPFGYYKRAYAKAFIGLINNITLEQTEIKRFIKNYTPPKEDKDW